MKNIVLSAVAVLAMSSFAVAGGDIAPVEEPVVVAEPVVTDAGLYLGLAYGAMDYSAEYSFRNVTVSDINDFTSSSIMVQAGYKFNSYVAIEGRYWFGLDETVDSLYGNDVDVNLGTVGIYVKPMYPVTDAFDIYALLGYADTTFDYKIANATIDALDHYNGFSWGLGVAYSFTDNLAVFVDYTDLYNDDTTDAIFIGDNIDETLASWNFGLTYQF